MSGERRGVGWGEGGRSHGLISSGVSAVAKKIGHFGPRLSRGLCGLKRDDMRSLVEEDVRCPSLDSGRVPRRHKSPPSLTYITLNYLLFPRRGGGGCRIREEKRGKWRTKEYREKVKEVLLAGESRGGGRRKEPGMDEDGDAS